MSGSRGVGTQSDGRCVAIEPKRRQGAGLESAQENEKSRNSSTIAVTKTPSARLIIESAHAYRIARTIATLIRILLVTASTAALLLAAAGAESQAAGEASDREKIEAAIPAKAFVSPLKPRKLLIFDLNVGYGGHASIPTANLAFTLMGQKTGAFEHGDQPRSGRLSTARA